jgi:hypothetical protein
LTIPIAPRAAERPSGCVSVKQFSPRSVLWVQDNKDLARLVAASGYSSAEDHANAKIAGFDSLMIKPLTEESLRALVD